MSQTLNTCTVRAHACVAYSTHACMFAYDTHTATRKCARRTCNISRYMHVYPLRLIRIIIPRTFNTHTACGYIQYSMFGIGRQSWILIIVRESIPRYYYNTGILTNPIDIYMYITGRSNIPHQVKSGYHKIHILYTGFQNKGTSSNKHTG